VHFCTGRALSNSLCWYMHGSIFALVLRVGTFWETFVRLFLGSLWTFLRNKINRGRSVFLPLVREITSLSSSMFDTWDFDEAL
jgi:hypothetical protein